MSHQQGVLGVPAIAASLLDAAHTRLALLGNEIEVEKLRAFRVLFLTQALLFCLGLAVVLAALLAAVVFPEDRALVLSGLVALFLLASWVCYRRLLHATANDQPLFAASLAELQEDLRQLKAAAH